MKRLLVAAGARTDFKDVETGQTALDIARLNEFVAFPEVLELLH